MQNTEHILSAEDIREYLGEATSIWDELTAYIEKQGQAECKLYNYSEVYHVVLYNNWFILYLHWVGDSCI